MNFKHIVKNSPTLIYKPIKYLYDKIPIQYKYSKRFKKIYSETYTFLRDSQWWTKEQLECYQFQQFKQILRHSYSSVPYYRKTFDQYGIDVEKISNFGDAKKIPFLTKEIIQNNINDLISIKYKKDKLSYMTTGGSTGIPMGFYIDADFELARENAFIDILYNRVNYRNGEKTFVLRGNLVETVNISNKKFIKENKNMNEIIASSYHLNERNMCYYIEELLKYKPVCIKAYPSSLYLLSLYIKENDIEGLDNIKKIILASENIYENQRELFNEVFKRAKIFSFYGHTEHACLAGECETSQYYHLQSEYGYTELIGERGEEANREGEIGEIVATSFNNYAMPLIRYRTSDLAINSNKICTCGRNYKLIKGIHGRIQEQIITEDGTKIALTSIIHSQHMDALGKVKEYQLIQNEKGKVEIKIVRSDKFRISDSEQIINKMESAADHKLKVNVEFVDHIDKTIRGKHKLLIQNIKD